MGKTSSIWPYVSNREKVIINEVLKSNKLNFWTGENCKTFENNFRKFFKRKFAITLNSGSVALDIAIKSLGLNNRSEVIVTPRSYISSASCVLNNNLKPVFSDVSIETQNIDLNSIKKKVSKRTKAIIVVHLGGMPSNIIEIMKFAKRRNIKVIEDCSQAHGAKVKNKYVGSFGDIAIWSFCNDKIMNTLGEGGMLCTNNKKIYQNAWSLRDCGKNILSVKKINKKDFKFKWLHDFNGSNYRMTEIQAAIGNFQLKMLPFWVKKRNEYANKIKKIVKNYKFVSVFNYNKNYINAYYRLYILINQNYLKKNWSTEKIINKLNKKKILCNFGACPLIYKEKVFLKKGYKLYLKNAESLNNNTISFTIHPNLKSDYFKHLKKELNKIFKKAEKNNVK